METESLLDTRATEETRDKPTRGARELTYGMDERGDGRESRDAESEAGENRDTEGEAEDEGEGRARVMEIEAREKTK